MHYVRLFWQMLRYRVAVMLLLFLLLGAATGGDVAAHWAQLLLAAVALAVSYVSATTSNDLADEEIDRINHAGHRGRPLVTGEATRADMWRLFGCVSAVALALVAPLGLVAVAIMLISLAVNVAYSLPPLRLSYRTWLAPLVLAVGYVGVPFALGLAVVGGRPGPLTWWLGAACYCLFVGRIVLKDFRDREGDAKYGKPTLLLKYGKTATCVVSAVMVVAGLGLLWLAGPAPAVLMLAPTVLIAAVLLQLWLLWRARRDREQLMIGVGAKLGNGALVILLGLMLLAQSGAAPDEQAVFAAAMTVVLLYSYARLMRSPELAVNGYRG
jgi:4-hydroxybenzoate polyprenyltransferase